ncbi:hypothetical protein F9C07_3553 [Aspergillus flavus]|uniref:Uncharacterized protein n=1 Tax=Aspergillus flavus (strain ATCC 200026 / FGSC A1120 / IAM 13836 / NRRL 3357 / JCM 12722 / SRRC 167) TaxID=332952 RepID=A0A7U2R0G3_ASPFN|nr:hypothetical protein F9C07_3553 [Aspergillus flavus]
MVLENGGGRDERLTDAGAGDVVEGSWGGTRFEMELDGFEILRLVLTSGALMYSNRYLDQKILKRERVLSLS